MSTRSEYRKVIRFAEREFCARHERGTGPHDSLLMPDGVRIPTKRGSSLDPNSARNLRADLRRWAEGRYRGLGRTWE